MKITMELPIELWHIISEYCYDEYKNMILVNKQLHKIIEQILNNMDPLTLLVFLKAI